MKQNLISFAAITAVLFAAVSCQVAGTPEAEKEIQQPNFIITTGQPDTKTYFEKDGDRDAYKSYWKGDATQGEGQGDMIRVYVDSNMGNQYRYDNKAENGAAARFEFGQTVVGDAMSLVEDQEYTLYGFHRNGRAIQKWNTGEEATTTTVAVEMLATQNPVSTSNPAATGPDGSSDFLIMKPVKFTYNSKVPATIETQFARISSVLRVKFADKTTGGKLDDYLVKNISIEAATKNLAGPAIVDLCENGGFIEHAILDQVGSKTASKKITVNYNGSISAKDGEMFFDMVPETYDNETFTITANLYNPEGGVAVISKSFTLATLAFKPGVITPLNLSVKDENITFAEFEGEGTNASPYLIYNEIDLRRLSDLTNGDEASSWVSKTYRQEQNITLSDDNFTPIAQTVGFTGTYNGQDKIISNLHIAITEDLVHNIGLFGTLKNPGRIIRVVVDGASVSTTQQSNFVGVLVGLAQGGTIDRCHVKNSSNTNVKNPAKGLILGGTTTAATTVKDCSVSNSTVSISNVAGYCVGGIVGRAGATITITGCVVGSDCKISGGYNLGGILGATHEYKLNVTIDKCVCYADITANNTATASSTGGIVGNVSTNNSNSNAQKVVISNCAYIGGTITSKYTGNGNVGVGGIVGKAGDGTNTDFSYDIINCQSSPAKLDASKTTANSAGTNWGVGGITGAARRIVNMYGCYCSTIQTNMLGGAAPHNGSVAPKLNTNSTAKYCFGQFTLVSDLSGTRPDATSEIVTAEKMTAATGVEGALIDKLNAAKAAYTGGKATLVDWVRGADGYPTLSGILADPDAAK